MESRLLPRPMPKPRLVDEEYGTAAPQNIQIIDQETGRMERVGPWAKERPDYINEMNTMNSDLRFQSTQWDKIKKYRARLGKT